MGKTAQLELEIDKLQAKENLKTAWAKIKGDKE